MTLLEVSAVDVKTAFYAWLVAKAPGTVTDIGEENYQGQSFVYPCIRYRVETYPDGCGNREVLCTISVLSEGTSSLEATQIMDTLVSSIHQHVMVSSGIRLQVSTVLGKQRSVREDRRWREEVSFKCLASRT